MKTDAAESKDFGHAPPHAAPAFSPLRFIVLVGVFVVLFGALLYDWGIAPPRVKAAYEKVLDSATKSNELALKSKTKKGGDANGNAAGGNDGLLYREDIQKIIGMAPTKVEKEKLYTIEHYCWWGWIPRKSNYITVLYLGSEENPHFSTHYANQMPEDEIVPGRKKFDGPVDPVATSGPKGPMPAGSPGAGGMGKMGPPGGGMGPMMGPPGMGPGMEPPGGKGKGRPMSKADLQEPKPKGADEGPKKSEEPKTNNEPAEEAKKESP